ncbi:MAG: dihydroorotase [Candidatus Rokubacteria bacterium GWC2_70_16]|nr:MAG: dihydroorotase [Candidatus Rokubacteria bacterium GWC2_70_16]OGL16208.1 MAG: dihydroorotase [Candidatus Rokubacteria bacterium RIFCSPLOWO2_12_FULL_71_19]
MDFDLILRGGTVVDPGQGVEGPCDVAFANGRVAAVAPDLSVTATEAIDVTGKLVTPGLIDLHGHFFHRGQPLFVDPDELCLPGGVTTAVDAGSSGWATYAGFREYVIQRAETRVLAFLHLATTGLATVAAGVGELEDFRFAQEERTRDALRRFPELLGLKVRIQRAATGEANALPALDMARRICDEAGTRLMVHISGTPIPLEAILERLRPGDIATHIFNGHEHGILDGAGQVLPAVRDAAARGVILDVAHAGVHFDVEVARAALAQGLPPTTLSTDMVRPAVARRMYDLLGVMSTFLALGLPLPEVIRAVTEAPARAIGQAGKLGALVPGACGDAAVLALEEGDFTFGDAAGHDIKAAQRFVPVLTVRAGRRWRRR